MEKVIAFPEKSAASVLTHIVTARRGVIRNEQIAELIGSRVITIAPDRYGELRIVFMIRDSRDYFAYRLGPGYLYLRANLNNEHHKQALDRLRSESDKEDGLVHLLPFKEDY